MQPTGPLRRILHPAAAIPAGRAHMDWVTVRHGAEWDGSDQLLTNDTMTGCPDNSLSLSSSSSSSPSHPEAFILLLHCTTGQDFGLTYSRISEEPRLSSSSSSSFYY